MKDTIIVICCLVLIAGMLVFIGFMAGKNSQSRRKATVSDIIQEVRVEWEEIYDRGFDAGERSGFDKGYLNCWNGLGMRWVGSYDRFVGFAREYGSLHNTLWSKFAIEEKAVIAMYGGSGSKLEPEEIEEWASKYGR